MAVRLKYAGVATDRVSIEPDLRAALRAAVDRTPPGETLHVLPTYTAMLQVRELLREEGHVRGFWQD
jgi:UDP-N-acetylmuramyl tripeptide synthase